MFTRSVIIALLMMLMLVIDGQEMTMFKLLGICFISAISLMVDLVVDNRK